MPRVHPLQRTLVTPQRLKIECRDGRSAHIESTVDDIAGNVLNVANVGDDIILSDEALFEEVVGFESSDRHVFLISQRPLFKRLPILDDRCK